MRQADGVEFSTRQIVKSSSAMPSVFLPRAGHVTYEQSWHNQALWIYLKSVFYA